MSMGQLLASGAAAVFSPSMFLMVCVAIVLGTVFGALPGVSATMAVALALTFTYTMQPTPAIVADTPGRAPKMVPSTMATMTIRNMVPPPQTALRPEINI